MSFNLDDVQIGGTLRVGTGVCPAVKDGDEGINGAIYAEGPVEFGNQTAFPQEQATLMIARTTNQDPDCEPADRSLWVKGNTRLEGDDGTANALNITGNTVQVGDTNQTGNITASGTVKANSFVGSIANTRDTPPGCKLFDIPNPSKEGYRLAHACIEGPEVAVYFRGVVKNEKIIKLPSYWKNLVHINSITIQLTPIGSHQDVIIKRWDDETIYLQSNGGMPIHCFYHVYAERKDVEKLIVEYVGESPADYPGDNSAYSVAGYNYDVRG
tara:strand:- start:194 stop:1003 length:810 start_codon:yes stop_codon:yes gene_type:complete